MNRISYAQNGEDILLARALPDVEIGTYVDVGAADPVIDSVTAHFYGNGWCGRNVEPNRTFWERLNADRSRDENLRAAVSDEHGTAVIYEDSNPYRGSLVPADAPMSLVETVTLTEVLVADRPIDFLKVDVEGHEEAVLRGHDWTTTRPRILCIESTDDAYRDWQPLLKGYAFGLWDGVNRFYVREEDEWRLPFFDHPACARDGFTSFWAHQCACRDAERGLPVSICVGCGAMKPYSRDLCEECAA